MKISIPKNLDRLIIVLLALGNVLLHLAYYGNLEFHRDELLYFALGLHPDFGYATVPPLIGWVASLLQTIFGYSLFAVKLLPALLSGVLVLLAAGIARELKGGTYARILTAVVIIFMPVTLRTFHLFQPVHLDLLLWTLLLYYTLRYVNTQKDKFLLALGVIAGIGMLNKYLIALLFIGLVVAILVSPHRSLFSKRTFYKGLLLAFLLFLPNLIWQIARDLPVIGHMEALNERQLVNVDRGDFLIDQLLMTFGGMFLVIPGLIYLFRNKEYRYLSITALFVVIVLLLLRGKSYYTMGVIPMLVAAGGVAIEKWIRNTWIRIVIPLFIIWFTLPVIPFGLPVYTESGLVQFFADMEEDYGLQIGRRFEDGTIHSLPQDYADQLGWEELTMKTASAYASIPEKNKALIYCENYGQASAIAVIGKKYGLPEPISFNESFLYWKPNAFDPDIEYFIYINDELGVNVAAFFDDIEVAGQITNPNAREFGTTIYLCSNPKGSFNAFYKDVVKDIQDPF